MANLVDKIQQAEAFTCEVLAAVRRYYEAKGLLPPDEVERLRLEVASLMQAVSEYQQSALGGQAATRH
ncbi:hypothetical protein G3436_16630 [Pseudomonas sp. MAFF212427]|uniref:Uncharacterized protein n=1 Tax=Pseudomonas brassicae TaxID=2708063 RepID=A0A6B3P0C6_9PSED|nr:hypothetical protein [Pseudomonas brassicae]NER65194.1 hypothetical protein [Pseudomonas brassicae]